MSETTTMLRTTLTVDGREHLLARGDSLEELKARIETVYAEGGGFVDFVVVGNRSVSVLITPTTRILATVETVEFDERDTGDEQHPFGGFFDL